MSVIAMRRMQQAVWAGLGQVNKSEGSGAGSGLSFGRNLATSGAIPSANFTGGVSPVLVSGSAATFGVSHAGAGVVITATLNAAVSPVTLGELIGVFLDGTQIGTTADAWISGSSATGLIYSCCTLIPVLTGAQLGTGQTHTVDWRMIPDSSGGTLHVVGGLINVFQIGG